MSIKKIASMVGVSPATVSRVLNNPNYRCSSPEIRDAIWEAAIELNYAPNEAARNLKMGLSNKEESPKYINILMTRTDANQLDPFFSELLLVIESEIHKRICILSKVWYMPFFSSDSKCEKEDLNRIVDEMYAETENRCDGLIIIGKCNIKALRLLKEKYKSVISVNRNPTNYEVDEVICDGHKMAATAVEHLIHLGHRKIGYVGDCHNETRYNGYIDTLRLHQIPIDTDFIFETTQTEAEGYDVMLQLLQSKNPPTGIYCANDITAIGMLKCLNQKKRPYYKPSIISSDDIEEAQNTKPMLTTVKVPREEMGRFALYMLLDRIRGGHEGVVRTELEGRLIVRSSCSSIETPSQP